MDERPPGDKGLGKKRVGWRGQPARSSREMNRVDIVMVVMTLQDGWGNDTTREGNWQMAYMGHSDPSVSKVVDRGRCTLSRESSVRLVCE